MKISNIFCSLSFFLCVMLTSCVSHTSSVNTGRRPSVSVNVRPQLEQLENGHYRVLEDWPVKIGQRSFIVQQGYSSNGITAPEKLKAFLGDHVDAPETWAAMFHDWCFTQEYLTRDQADSYFIELMHDYQINAHKVQLMGATVRGYTLYKGIQ